MIAYRFHARGNGAAGKANVGQGKFDATPSLIPLTTPAYRAQQAAGGEQQLLAHLTAQLGHIFPAGFLTAYYVALKTSPFVVLTGPEGTGKAALAAGLARSLVGSASGQFVTIGSDSWARRGSQASYYRGIHERFGISQLSETLQEAAAPESMGKLFFVLLRGLTAEELDSYLNGMLRVSPSGERRLALPGLALDEQPVIPPNCFLTATLHTSPEVALDPQLLKQAGRIEVSAALHAEAQLPELPPPPVGFQRTMLAALRRDPRCARAELINLLGRRDLATLTPSPTLSRRLIEQGIALSRSQREAALAYVANSFDADGRGLFDATNPLRNAQLAFEVQLSHLVLDAVELG
ncbi:MAG: hypothetical protein AB4911_09345 [Oscillochloridaceae bacterium umkhey_bin13]